MAFSLNKITFTIFVVALYILSFPPHQSHSLSTVSISYTSNQTLVCAIIPSPTNPQQTSLNCSSFPSGIQVDLGHQNVSYTRIVGGKGFLCAVRSQPLASVMDCWRFLDLGTPMSHRRVYKGPVLSEIVASDTHVCGVVSGSNDTLTCWLWREWESKSPSTSFSSIAVGQDFVCGLGKSNGNIICSGNDLNVTNKQPSGKYSVISAGSSYACAISFNGSLNCWGNMSGDKLDGVFKDLALGDTRSCALRENGTALCWGTGKFEVPTRLQETYFTGIMANGEVFCGIVTSNYSLVCWGNEVIEKGMFVFDSVMPGACTSECPCSPLPDYAKFCANELMICQPCDQGIGSSDSPSVPSGNAKGKRSNKWSPEIIVFLAIGCFGSLSLIAIIVFFLCQYCRGKGCRVHDSGPLEQAAAGQGVREQGQRLESVEEEQVVVPVHKLEKRLSHMYSMGKGGNVEEFTLDVLQEVTGNFSIERRIGIGSFGTVYYATLEDGREVAIKRAEVSTSIGAAIRRRQEDKDIAFMAELELLSRLNHKHLVRLLGFYEDENERVLVYEFMNNLTLHDHLHKLKDASPLASWPARIKVALDAARGIDYLHAYAMPPIIHRDIKPSNILLDNNWTAKVSDFGLSLMGPPEGESHLSLRAAGTFGYVDPEYYRLHQLTTKSDVYSFGVVLLELLSGYKAIHTTNEDGTPRNVVDFLVPYIVRGDMHRVLDPNVPPPTPVEIEAVMFVGDLAVDCVNPEGRNRPSMSEVVTCLERALAACLVRPTLSSSSTASST